MEESILKSTKKLLNVSELDTSFDLDIVTYVKTAISRLKQLGFVTVPGVSVNDATTTWAQMFGDEPLLDDIKTYVALRSRMLFDPPGTSYHIAAMNEAKAEIETTLATEKGLIIWTDPITGEPSAVPEGVVSGGGF